MNIYIYHRLVRHSFYLFSLTFLTLSGCEADIRFDKRSHLSEDYELDAKVPAIYQPGEEVAIQGSGFTQTHKVVINGKTYPTKFISAEEIRFTMP